jgi:hypothetical protein
MGRRENKRQRLLRVGLKDLVLEMIGGGAGI